MAVPNRITQALRKGVQDGVFPGAVLFVRQQTTVLYHEAVGLLSALPSSGAVHLNTLYDLASLTKPLATASALVCLVQDGLVPLDQPVSSLLKDLHESPIGKVTIRNLLAHRSGLPDWRPYYNQLPLKEGMWLRSETNKKRREVFLNRIGQETLVYSPGSQALYSDLGFMLLGLAIEEQTQQSLFQFCQDRIFDPLGAQPLIFPDNETEQGTKQPSKRIFAPTEYDPWRGRLVQGEVHDENAFALGGIAGHAGLFGTAEAVAGITGAWLEGYWGRNPFFDQSIIQEFVGRLPGSTWALGWDTPSNPSSSGTRFSPLAFGHLGFTGTSIWIDPSVDLEVILLSNRVHPTRKNDQIREFRPMIHDLIYQECIGK